MQRHYLITQLAFVLLVLVPATGLAAAKINLETTIEKRELRVTDGKEEIRFVPSDQAIPGDQLRFTLTFSNVGDEVAKDVVLDNPVPASATYLPESATPYESVTPLFSIDNGVTFDTPKNLNIERTTPDGSQEPTTAPPEAYTHIRWQLPPIPAGAAGQVSFNVQIQ